MKEKAKSALPHSAEELKEKVNTDVCFRIVFSLWRRKHNFLYVLIDITIF